MSHELLAVCSGGAQLLASPTVKVAETLQFPKPLCCRKPAEWNCLALQSCWGRVRDTAVTERPLHRKCEQNSMNAKGQGTIRN